LGTALILQSNSAQNYLIMDANTMPLSGPLLASYFQVRQCHSNFRTSPDDSRKRKLHLDMLKHHSYTHSIVLLCIE